MEVVVTQAVLDGAAMIVAERRRQIDGEGYSLEHDRQHGAAVLATAAEAYLTGRADLWPWEPAAFKPSADIRRNLIKAGALTAAAIDALSAQ